MCDAREEPQHHYVSTHLIERCDLAFVGDVVDVMMCPSDVYTHTCQRWIVGRSERIELFARQFLGTIASEQQTLEVDAHFGHHGHADAVFGCSYLDARDQVFLAIGTQYTDGQLRTRQYHRLGEVLEHVTESRGSVGHRVGSVQHHKSVVLVIVIDDDACHVRPKGRIHVRRIQRWVELYGVEVDRYTLQLRDVTQQVAEVEWLMSSRERVLNHTDGTTGINDQYMW